MEFARKHRFKLTKLEHPIYIRDINSIFNQESLIKHTVKYIFYKGHTERIEIDMVEKKK